MPRRSTLRASDADRELVADRLRRAAAEGRLLTEELEERVGRVFAARTYGELDAVVIDLPRTGVTPRGPRGLSTVRHVPLPALVLLTPIAVAMVVAAVVIVTTLFAAWALIVAIAWLAMGRRAALYGFRPPRPLRTSPRWRA
jgi:hypothetical protein